MRLPKEPREVQKIKDRLKSKTKADGDCLIWTGNVVRRYGHICLTFPKRNEKTVKAHRLSFALFKGKIPKGLYVLHTCDRPLCINPEHLWLGTAKDNMLDMSDKGRSPKQKNTHCPKGHPLSGENLRMPKPKRGNHRPWRRCRTCDQESLRRYRERRKVSRSEFMAAATGTNDLHVDW
jgi:hypothetical protein